MPFRRCGSGIAKLNQDSTFFFCVFFPLEGELQTVPRSELYVILVVALSVQRLVSVIVYTDSEICVKGFAEVRKGGR